MDKIITESKMIERLKKLLTHKSKNVKFVLEQNSDCSRYVRCTIKENETPRDIYDYRTHNIDFYFNSKTISYEGTSSIWTSSTVSDEVFKYFLNEFNSMTIL